LPDHEVNAVPDRDRLQASAVTDLVRAGSTSAIDRERYRNLVPEVARHTSSEWTSA
jgi:hypothetical protein